MGLSCGDGEHDFVSVFLFFLPLFFTKLVNGEVEDFGSQFSFLESN